MTLIAVVGNVSIDRIDGLDDAPGGCPTYAVQALEAIQANGEVVTRFASTDDALFDAVLTSPRVRLVRLLASRTAAFDIRNAGDERTISITRLPPSWTSCELSQLGLSAPWVHVAPISRADFDADGLAVLAGSCNRISLDGQGLVRVPRAGPMRLDAEFDIRMLRHVTVLKLSEQEAQTVAGGAFGRDTAARLGVPEILVTRGSRGCDVYCNQSVVHVPVVRPFDVDATGAGDIFATTYGFHRQGGAMPQAAAERASLAVAQILARRLARSQDHEEDDDQSNDSAVSAP